MTVRPQAQIKAPRVKAVAFLAVLAAAAFAGLCAANEHMTKVAIVTKDVDAFTTIQMSDVGLRDVSDSEAADVVAGAEGLVGQVALADLVHDEPVTKTDVSPPPTCKGIATSGFGVIVVPLRAPVPSTVKRGSRVQLRTSPVDSDVARQAVFMQAVDAPADVTAEARAVAYAEVLIGVGDWAGFGAPSAWSMLAAPDC